MTTRERLAALGKHKRDLEITIGGETVTVQYKRPNTAQTNDLEEKKESEYNALRKRYRTALDGEESRESRLRAYLNAADLDKALDILIQADNQNYRAAALKRMELERPEPDSSEEIKAAFEAEYLEHYRAVTDEAKAQIKDARDRDAIIEDAIEKNLHYTAASEVFENHCKRLVVASLFDAEPPHGQLYESQDELELELVPETIKGLADMVLREVSISNGLPLK
jgi:hypothetical protein